MINTVFENLHLSELGLSLSYIHLYMHTYTHAEAHVVKWINISIVHLLNSFLIQFCSSPLFIPSLPFLSLPFLSLLPSTSRVPHSSSLTFKPSLGYFIYLHFFFHSVPLAFSLSNSDPQSMIFILANVFTAFPRPISGCLCSSLSLFLISVFYHCPSLISSTSVFTTDCGLWGELSGEWISCLIYLRSPYMERKTGVCIERWAMTR